MYDAEMRKEKEREAKEGWRRSGGAAGPPGGRRDYNLSHYCAIDVPGGIFPFDNAVTHLCI